MKIIEIFANRRSGHHLFLSWLISNITDQKDEKTNKLNKITWLNKDVCHYNDITYHAFFNKKKVDEEVREIIDKKPKYFFINYEELNIVNQVNNEKSVIFEYEPTKIVFVRDFLNVMASKWAVSKTDMRNVYYGFENDKHILENIESWKKSVKNYLSGKYVRFTYEELITDKEKRQKFLSINFDVEEKFTISELNGTNSSFKTNNFNNRYKEVNFSDRFKELYNKDEELKFLINEMGYNVLQ